VLIIGSVKNIDVYLVTVFLLIFAGVGILLLTRGKSQGDTQVDALGTESAEEQQTDQQDSVLTPTQEVPESENVVPAEQGEEEVKVIETMNTPTLSLQDKLNFQKPDMQIDSEKSYFAIVKTSQGDIEIKLNVDKTPITVNNFVALARAGFYSDVIFHRVIDGFMIQTGDPTGTGAGSPAYKFDDEAFEGEYTRGTVAMANAGSNTNGSQFFIMQADNNDLLKSYVIFGQVISGIDIVDKIAKAEVVPSDSGEVSKPINPVVINSIEISESDSNN